MTALRIAFAGTPEFSVPPLHALARSEHKLVGVLTQPDRPKGRGQRTSASPVKQAAESYGLPVSQPQTLKTEEGRIDLALWNADLLVVVAYGLILPPAVLAIPRLGCVNIHASLLPRWRGAAPIHRSILSGDVETGITIMLMDAGLDTGPMLLQKRLPIGPTDTSSTLHDNLAELGASALLEALSGWTSGVLKPVTQPTEGVTYAAKIDKAEALIDWQGNARDIERKVRAFNPWPVAETRMDGEQLRIYAARAIDAWPNATARAARVAAGPAVPGAELNAQSSGGHASEHAAVGSAQADAGNTARTSLPVAPSAAGPGTIVEASADGVAVHCGEGFLLLTEVQRPGRKPISARDFANTANLVGRRLG